MKSTTSLKAIIALLTLFLAVSLYFNFSSTTKTEVVEGFQETKPSTMSSILVKTMINQYKNNQYAVINADRKLKTQKNRNFMGDDARSIGFNVDTIKKFIHDIEKNVSVNNIDTKLGLRMYYAAYPDESEFLKFREIAGLTKDSITKKYATRHTLIIIPTIYNKKLDRYVDFNPLDKSTYNGFSSKKGQNNAQNQKSMSLMSSEDNIMGKNHGSLIPPVTADEEGF